MNKFLTIIFIIHSFGTLAQTDLPNKFDQLQVACENASELFEIWQTMQELEITEYQEMATDYKLPQFNKLVKNRTAAIGQHQESLKKCVLPPDTFPSDKLFRQILRSLYNSVTLMRPKLLEEYGDPYEINDRIKIVKDTYFETMGIPVPEEEPYCYL